MLSSLRRPAPRSALLLLLLTLAACSSPEDRDPPAASPDASMSDLGDDAGDEGDLLDDAEDLGDLDEGVIDPPDMEADAEAEAEMGVEPEPLRDPVTLITPDELLAHVDPFIGTGGAGFGYAAMTPAAQVPLGLVKVGPDTTRGGVHGDKQHMSGYNADDPHVRGFSHLHFVGTGVADYGNLRVTPTRSLDKLGSNSLYATQDKARERARPGLYATSLLEPAVSVELTATTRAAAHRYAFAPAGEGGERGAYLVIDPSSSVTDSGVEAIDVRVDPSTGQITGSVRYRGPYVGRRRPFTLSFEAIVSIPPSRAFVWDADGAHESLTELPDPQAEKGGVVLAWDEAPSSPIELRVGLSLVDAQGAHENLTSEAPLSSSFEAIAQQAEDAWLDKLSRVLVAGGTASERTIFYTALYNAYRMPTRFDDGDGRYRGLDGEIHASAHPYYTDLSLWDSFRTTHPLYTLIDAEVARDVLSSLLAMADDGGSLPRWPAALSYTGGMTGSSADILFGEAAAKGLEGVDWQRALQAVLITADGPPPAESGGRGRELVEEYIALGYVPADSSKASAAMSLEYAYNDWAISHLAEAAGEPDIAARFLARSKNYRRLFDPQTGFLRAKMRDGSFVQSFDPIEVEPRSGENYAEGSAWHYRFYALQDPEGLVELLGGKSALGEALETLFSRSKFGESILGPHFLPDSYYWHGNQPPLHSASMFAYSDRPERQGYWLDQIRRRYYATTPAGLPGNDDGGTLSSWYVFHALGFYPVAGGAGYILGSPIFTRAEVRMSPDATLSIAAPEAAPAHRKVTGARLDDAPVTTPQITHQQLPGHTLSFTLSAYE